MVTLRSRGETVGQTETVQLRALFKDSSGNPVDLDSFPTITIIQPSGNVVAGPTSTGVYRVSTGLYGYDWYAGYNASIGVYTDVWDGILSGYSVSGTFNFVVQNTMLPAVNTDGYIHLGDDPGFDYSQTSMNNINLLIKTLKARLNSKGLRYAKDEYGNDTYADCDIFSIESLVSFLADALSRFNLVPHWTFYTFEDTEFFQQFHHLIVRGATLMALSSKALIERGREFVLTDQGVNFNPPTVSELMSTEWSTEWASFIEELNYVKGNMKPGPIALGTLTISTTRHPAVARLRHLRARQIV
jgi:hypothetical protein